MGLQVYECATPGCLYTHDGWGSDYCRECRDHRRSMAMFWCERCDEHLDKSQRCDHSQLNACKWCCQCGQCGGRVEE